MRRLTRRLFTICSGASLVLCLAVCVLWVRSYSVRDELFWGNWRVPGGDECSWSLLASSNCGRFHLARSGPSRSTGVFWDGLRPNPVAADIEGGREVGLGVWIGGPYWRSGDRLAILIPYPVLLIGSAILPSFWLYMARRKRRA